ncbi:hypothetical protein [Mesorhizobium sp. M0809]
MGKQRDEKDVWESLLQDELAYKPGVAVIRSSFQLSLPKIDQKGQGKRW